MIRLKKNNWAKIKPRRWQKEAYEKIRNHYSNKEHKPAVVSAIMGAGKSVLISHVCSNINLKHKEVVIVTTSGVVLVNDLFRSINRESKSRWFNQAKGISEVIVTTYHSVGALAKQLKKEGISVKLWIADEVHRTETQRIIKVTKKILRPKHYLGFTATPFRSLEDETISMFKECIYRYGVKDGQKDGIIVHWNIQNHRNKKIKEPNLACMKMIKKAKGPGMVNARDIADAEAFTKYLKKHGIKADYIHSHISYKTIMEKLKSLQDEKIKCIVYVNILSEGVNFPWLRWMCLRRPVKARVRFIQEIGRLLRSYPGKTEAVFYDPCDLWHFFRITYEDALGEYKEKDTTKTVVQDPEEIARRMKLDDALAMKLSEVTVRALKMETDACGMLLKNTPTPRNKRVKKSTKKQWETISDLYKEIKAIVPKIWKDCVKQLVSNRKLLRRGYASDFINVLKSFHQYRLWPDPEATVYPYFNGKEVVAKLFKTGTRIEFDGEEMAPKSL